MVKSDSSIPPVYGEVSVLSYCAVDKIEKNEVGGACSLYGGGERRVHGFGGET